MSFITSTTDLVEGSSEKKWPTKIQSFFGGFPSLNSGKLYLLVQIDHCWLHLSNSHSTAATLETLETSSFSRMWARSLSQNGHFSVQFQQLMCHLHQLVQHWPVLHKVIARFQGNHSSDCESEAVQKSRFWRCVQQGTSIHITQNHPNGMINYEGNMFQNIEIIKLTVKLT